jgi:hypothetical protein
MPTNQALVGARFLKTGRSYGWCRMPGGTSDFRNLKLDVPVRSF